MEAVLGSLKEARVRETKEGVLGPCCLSVFYVPTFTVCYFSMPAFTVFASGSAVRYGKVK